MEISLPKEPRYLYRENYQKNKLRIISVNQNSITCIFNNRKISITAKNLEDLISRYFPGEIYEAIPDNTKKNIIINFPTGRVVVENAYGNFKYKELKILNNKLASYIDENNIENYHRKFKKVSKRSLTKATVALLSGVVIAGTSIAAIAQSLNSDNNIIHLMTSQNSLHNELPLTQESEYEKIVTNAYDETIAKDIPLESIETPPQEFEQSINIETSSNTIYLKPIISDGFIDKTNSEELKKVRMHHESTINKYTSTYGVNYELIASILAKESSGKEWVRTKKAVGISQIQLSNDDGIIRAYNHQTKEWDVYYLYYAPPDASKTKLEELETKKLETIEKWNSANKKAKQIDGIIDLSDLEHDNDLAIKVCAMFLQRSMEECKNLIGYYNPVVAILIYNHGSPTVKDIINHVGGVEHLNDLKFLDAQKIREITKTGGVKYVEGVVGFLSEGKFVYQTPAGDELAFDLNVTDNPLELEEESPKLNM